jgi:hypothetical protein
LVSLKIKLKRTRIYLDITSGACSVASTSSDERALLGRSADATTITTERSTAALRLALIVLEEKERIGAGLKLGTIQRLIRSIVLPLADIVARLEANIIKRTDRLIRITPS